MTTATKGRTTLILASASPRRSEILARLGFSLVIEPSTMPEPERMPGELPSNYVLRAARAKAQDIAGRHRSGWIVGADTIVVARNHFLGKPACDLEASGMLRSLSGRWHEVHTGLCLINRSAVRSASGCSCSRVHFRRLTSDDIEGYLVTGEHRDKAGAYAIQGFASLFIDRIEGCYFNIVGFPIFTFARLCRRLGLAITP